jgi:hypothetical protein
MLLVSKWQNEIDNEHNCFKKVFYSFKRNSNYIEIMIRKWKDKIVVIATKILIVVLKRTVFAMNNGPKKKYLKVELKGGLSNKLFYLFSSCDIAIKNNCVLVEPSFGWKKKILFSDVYDLNYFNEKMKIYNNGNDLMISRGQIKYNLQIQSTIINNNVDLWKYSEDILTKQRSDKRMSKDCMNIIVLKALKLNKRYLDIVENQLKDKSFTAIQIRTESDWVKHAEHIVVDEDETLLINIDKLIEMVSELGFVEKLFFTSGENHDVIVNTFNKFNYQPDFFFNANYEYEINAAINFEICCHSRSFIGLSRSTYSNLISLKRALLENDNSFIYNYGNKIYRRLDKGLQPVAKQSILDGTSIY